MYHKKKHILEDFIRRHTDTLEKKDLFLKVLKENNILDPNEDIIRILRSKTEYVDDFKFKWLIEQEKLSNQPSGSIYRKAQQEYNSCIEVTTNLGNTINEFKNVLKNFTKNSIKEFLEKPHINEFKTIYSFLEKFLTIDNDPLELYNICKTIFKKLLNEIEQKSHTWNNLLDQWQYAMDYANDKEQALLQKRNNLLKKNTEIIQKNLKKMRSIIPPNITNISIKELMEYGYSFELAQRLKKYKMLHWIVMHKDYIPKYNLFLKYQNDTEKYYEKFNNFDFVELCAIAGALNDIKLDFDSNKKQEINSIYEGLWRYIMGALENPTFVEKRNSLYFIPTKEELLYRVNNIEKKLNNTILKKNSLEKELVNKNIILIKEKQEWNNIIEDYNNKIVNKDIIRWVKNIIRENIQNLNKDITKIEKHIINIDILIDKCQHSIEELNIYIKKEPQFGQEIQNIILWSGSIKHKNNNIIKKLTLEEEKQLRKKELQQLHKNPQKEISNKKPILTFNGDISKIKSQTLKKKEMKKILN